MSITFTEKYVEPIRHTLWNNEFEPKTLKDIIGNQTIMETIDSFVRSNHIPNLILCGPNGCGKTTTAKILTGLYLGNNNTNNMEIIGSIYRGKNVVSEKNDKKKPTDNMLDSPNIINFIKKKTNLPVDKFKIVTIYDFDCMTSEAQMALRRIIEIYANKVRFIFICNSVNKIIEAIQSRTLILKFHPIEMDEIINKMISISKEKDIHMSNSIYEAISILSNGDLKQAINYLQVFSNSNIDKRTLENFYNLFNIPSLSTINNLISHCLKGRGKDAFVIVDKLFDNGYNVTDVLDIIIKALIYNRDIHKDDRIFLIEETIKIISINEQCTSLVHLYKWVVSVMKRKDEKLF